MNNHQRISLCKIAAKIAAKQTKTLTLKQEHGRKQIWDVDGSEVKITAGDGYLSVSGDNPASIVLIFDFISGALDVDEYPKVGQSISVIPVRDSDPGVTTKNGIYTLTM